MTLFPMIQPEAGEAAGAEEEYPLYREVKWDYEKNAPVYRGGGPVFTEGVQAVQVWAWKALHTPRFRHEIYSWNYGSEVESLVGEAYSDELKKAEAARYVKECLLINPYLTDVKNLSVEFSRDRLAISGKLITVYGEAELHV